jgi:hypothetical protein
MKDRLKFLAKRNIKYSMGSCALVVAYNMKQRKLLNIYHTPDGLIDAVYGVIKPDVTV